MPCAPEKSRTEHKSWHRKDLHPLGQMHPLKRVMHPLEGNSINAVVLCHVVQPKKILHRKAPIPERFRGFFVPRFWGANKKIFFFARRI